MKQALQKVKFGHHLWWQLGIFLIAAYFLYPYSVRFANYFNYYAPERYAFPSVFNERPSGLSGLLKITKLSNIKFQTWTKPYRDLTDKAGTLLIVDPNRSLNKV
ncbi:MAG: DUF4350 domain-containing protein, partial [Candidatus Obscuribacterales bacterium]|nr:DUF4350 domain-containing protein [Candidatus Obscuribacterales bacterium]